MFIQYTNLHCLQSELSLSSTLCTQIPVDFDRCISYSLKIIILLLHLSFNLFFVMICSHLTNAKSSSSFVTVCSILPLSLANPCCVFVSSRLLTTSPHLRLASCTLRFSSAFVFCTCSSFRLIFSSWSRISLNTLSTYTWHALACPTNSPTCEA